MTMSDRATVRGRLARAVRRRRELARLLTADEDREPSVDEQRAWIRACNEARNLRERVGGPSGGEEAPNALDAILGPRVGTH
jgi:hypothetical protein